MKSNIYNRKVEFRTIADFVYYSIANVNASTFTYMVNVRSGK